ncbi:MAG: serine/threonine protein phosphatase PrpC [Myxococcota bacterium]|jgi:serine/threonine protein phosphatase PrpC
MRVSASAGRSVAGRPGRDNEDALFEDAEVPLYAVVDGSGGSAAAQHALAAFEREGVTLAAHAEKVSRTASSGHRLEVARTFETVFNAASDQLYRAWHDAGGSQLSAAAAACTVLGDFAYVTHVGDARAYLWRDGKLRFLTMDHTLAMHQLRQGDITREEYAKSPFRKTLTQALGVANHVSPDTAEVRLIPGDRILLCSDGLHRSVGNRAIKQLLTERDSVEACVNALLAKAIARGKRDDITAILLEFSLGGRAIKSERASTVHLTGDLAEIFLFEDLSDAERLVIAPYFDHRILKAGEVLCREGEVGDTFFILTKGRAAVTHGETHLTELGPGSYAGEIALTRAGPRTATITALAQSEALALSRPRFLELVRRRPDIGARLVLPLLRNVGARVVDLRSRFDRIGALMSG